MNLENAAQYIQSFETGNLSQRLASLEADFSNCTAQSASELCQRYELTNSLLEAGLTFKGIAGQINVLIHAIGILVAIPRILEDGERIETLSLGAGNTGRRFDLETNLE